VASSRIPDLNKIASLQRDAFSAITGYIEEMNNLKEKIPQKETVLGKKDESKFKDPSNIQEKWINAGEVASFLGLKKEPQDETSGSSMLEVPVQVDLVFLGFEGDGGNMLKVHPEELDKWFEHIEGALPHITLESVKPRSPFEKVGNSNEGFLPYRLAIEDLKYALHMNPLPWDPHPQQSQGRVHREITYNYKFHVVEVSDQVLPELEAVMQTFLRFDDNSAGSEGYIPAWYMEEALASLTEVLTKTRWEVLEQPNYDFIIPELIADGPAAAFTLYIINPKLMWLSKFKHQSYGYRWGFSWAHIASVADEPDVVDKARHVAKNMALETLKKSKAKKEKNKEAEAFLSSQAPFLQAGFGRRPPDVAPRTGMIRWRNSKDATKGWAERQHAKIKGVEKDQPVVDEISQLLEAEEVSPVQISVMNQILTHHAGPLDLEGALSEMWLSGNGRFGWIDLGAGPFSWGPMVGGTGAKTQNSPQRVPPPKSLSGVREVPSKQPSSSEMMTLEESQARFAILSEYIDRRKVRAESLEEQMGCDLRSSGGRWKGSKMQAIAIEQHQNIKAVTCYQLAEQLEMLGTLEHHLQQFNEMKMALMDKPVIKQKDEAVQKGLEGIYIAEVKMLEFVKEILSPVTESDYESETADDDKPIHFFLANLAAYTSKLAEHILTPPLAVTPLEAGKIASVPWVPDQIVINLYVVNTRPNTEATLLTTGGFDVVWFKDQLLSLELGEMTFTSQELDLTEDPALATAYTSSIKEYTRPDGEGEISKGKYIDSTLLRSQLTLPETNSEDEQKVRVKHVPVFLFSVKEDHPVYIDEYYEARALDDMVIIVQSPQRVSSTPLESNGRAVYRSAHNPMGPALQAMANYLGGVLPSHVTYTPGTQALSQDWFWNVGESPLNPLSLHPRFSAMDKDKIHRSQVIQVLDASIELTREATTFLSRARTSSDNYKIFRAINGTLHNIQSEFEDIDALQNQILHMVDHLRYDKARNMLNPLLERSKRVSQVAEEVFMLVHPTYCDKTYTDTEAKQSSNSYLLELSLLFFLSSIFGFLFFTPTEKISRKFKPKIN